MSRVPHDFDIDASVAEYRATKIAQVKTFAEVLADIEADTKELRNSYEAAMVAEANGFEHDWYPGSRWTVDINIQRSQLTDVRRVFGKSTVLGKDLENANDETIRVTLKFEAWPKLRVRYIRPLPPGSRCQIVEEVRPESRYHALVCNR